MWKVTKKFKSSLTSLSPILTPNSQPNAYINKENLKANAMNLELPFQKHSIVCYKIEKEKNNLSRRLLWKDASPTLEVLVTHIDVIQEIETSIIINPSRHHWHNKKKIL